MLINSIEIFSNTNFNTLLERITTAVVLSKSNNYIRLIFTIV